MLAHRTLVAGDDPPDQLMLFLHGVLGRGRNWLSIARRFVEARPGWGAVLVDLRLHGDSRDRPGPHTVAAAAADLAELAGGLDAPVRGVVGHSFGGKVALQWAALGADSLEELWVLDSPPGARPDAAGVEGVVQVLDALRGVDGPLPSRDAFLERMADAGLSQGLARWLGTNLERTEQGTYALALDLDAIGEILDDYYQQDLWPEVEHPSGGHQVHLVIGERSEVFGSDDRTRAEGAAASSPRVHVHWIADAGHWLHVDAPDALVALLAGSGHG
jgi:esterase